MSKRVVVFQLGEGDVFETGEYDLLVKDVAARALNSGGLDNLFEAGVEYAFKASRPRAVRALFAHAGVVLPEGEWITVPYNMAALKAKVGQPWYPVIDRERCVACGLCFDYCLFGVYSRDAEGKVAVTKPQACKPGCPACARICVQSGVIFPFCPEEPINGAEPQAQATGAEALQALTADPLARLRQR